MNFKRIEWIFFIAFIALDIFLVVSFLRQNSQLISVTNSREDATNSIMKSIRSEQISYGSLSDKTSTGFYLASTNEDSLQRQAQTLKNVSWTYVNNRLEVNFVSPIKIDDKKGLKQTLKTILDNKTLISNGQDYVYTADLSTDKRAICFQEIYGLPLYSEDGAISFSIKDGYVTGYVQTYLDNLQILREKKKTISQKRALIWLYQYNKLPYNSSVEWCHLGYSKLLAVNGSTIYIPTWNFSIKNKSSESVVYRRINAFTGAVIDGTMNIN